MSINQEIKGLQQEMALLRRRAQDAESAAAYRVEQAEARVAELTIARDQARGCQTAALDALDQARGLLVVLLSCEAGPCSCTYCKLYGGADKATAWLRAHPATATPAATETGPRTLADIGQTLEIRAAELGANLKRWELSWRQK